MKKLKWGTCCLLALLMSVHGAKAWDPKKDGWEELDKKQHHVWEILYDDTLRSRSASDAAIEDAAPTIHEVIEDTRKPIELDIGKWRTMVNSFSGAGKTLFPDFASRLQSLESGLDVLSPGFQSFLERLPEDKATLEGFLDRKKQTALDRLSGELEDPQKAGELKSVIEGCNWSATCVRSQLGQREGFEDVLHGDFLELQMSGINDISSDIKTMDDMIAGSGELSSDHLTSLIAERVTASDLSSLLGDAMTVDSTRASLEGKTAEEVQQYFYNQAYAQMVIDPVQMQSSWDKVYSKVGAEGLPVDITRPGHKEFAATVIAQVAAENYLKNK